MLKTSKLLLSASALAGLFIFQACNDKKKDEYTKTPSGVEYKLYGKNEAGKYEIKDPVVNADSISPEREGKLLILQIEYLLNRPNMEDSVLFSTYKNNTPVPFPVMKPAYKGSIEEAFMMLQPGDSAIIRMAADSFFTKTVQSPLPPFIKPGNTLTFKVKADALQTQEEAMADQQKRMMEEQQKELKHAEDMKPKDDATIQEYIKKNNLKAEKTANGVYYIITKPGTGPKAQAGQVVSVKYTGKLLDGKVFDSSEKHGGAPFEFPLGQGRVIPGWDEGVAQLNKGAVATFIIPSWQAYGGRGAGNDIPADAILLFDVELVDIKSMQPQQMPMQPGR